MDVKIHKEIRSFKGKIFGGLNIRQLICLIAGFIVMVPSYYFMTSELKMNSDLVGWIVLAVGLPIFAIGFFYYHGMTFEKFVFTIVKNSFIYPKIRRYQTINTMEEIIKYKDPEDLKTTKDIEKKQTPINFNLNDKK